MRHNNIKNSLLKKLLRIIFRNISKQLVGTGISKNRTVYNFVEFMKEKIKEDFVIVDGCKLLLDKTDRHGFTIYGEEDHIERELIKKIVRPGDVTIDVGANIGYHTVVMAKIVGKTGHVYAFEPSPYNVELLKKTMELNGFQNVSVIHKAVSEQPGKSFLYFSNGISAHSLTNFGYNNGGIEVSIDSLDNFFKDLDKKINFVKIDAEGYDFKVIRGMKNILKTPNLKLLIEFFPERLKKTGESPKEFLEFLFENQFNVIDLKKNKPLTVNDVNEIVRIYDSPPPDHMTNFFCEKI